MAKGGWVYIMANRYRGGMYVGVTADLTQRVWQHREGTGSIHVGNLTKGGSFTPNVMRTSKRGLPVKSWSRSGAGSGSLP